MMERTRFQKAKLNMITTLLYQIVTIVCGLVIPRIMITNFGSEVYGAVNSITQFLSYVTLLEGGIGGVARAELYKPLADCDADRISMVYNAISRFFRGVGSLFMCYALVVALSYHRIANVAFFDASYTFFLVIAISISTVAQYFFGIANLTLLNADQKRYISSVVMIVTTIVNALLVMILVRLNCGILTVKLCSSCIFVLRPIVFSAYVKRNYKIDRRIKSDGSVLQQKWTGLGQHLAYCLHNNTDVSILTLMADLKYVAVYSVYNLAISSIRNIVVSLTGGMEAVFGDMIAKNEEKALRSAYKQYDLLVSYAAIVLFGTASILIVPFVRLYTKGVADAEYIQPLFAQIALIAEAINCIFLPCSTLPVAANKFRETRVGAYGEVLINVVLSCILVKWNPLLGVAIGTVAAVAFKSVFYYIYVTKNILRISMKEACHYVVHMLVLLGIILCGNFLIGFVTLDSMVQWIACGFVVVVCVAVVVFTIYAVVFGVQFRNVVKRMLVRMQHKK